MQLLPATRMALLLSLCLSMTACLVTVDSDERSRHTQWNRFDADRIIVGETTEAEIRETFGTPNRQSAYPDGSSIWRYENSSERETTVGMFLLFHIDVESEDAEMLAIELDNGVVTDYWVEER